MSRAFMFSFSWGKTPPPPSLTGSWSELGGGRFPPLYPTIQHTIYFDAGKCFCNISWLFAKLRPPWLLLLAYKLYNELRFSVK